MSMLVHLHQNCVPIRESTTRRAQPGRTRSWMSMLIQSTYTYLVFVSKVAITVSDIKIGPFSFNAPCTRWAKFMCGLYVLVFVCVCVCMCVYVCLCVCVCMCVWMYVWICIGVCVCFTSMSFWIDLLVVFLCFGLGFWCNKQDLRPRDQCVFDILTILRSSFAVVFWERPVDFSVVAFRLSKCVSVV